MDQVKDIALFFGDHPRHVCPVIRVLAPAELLGITVHFGTEREEGELRSYPERVSEADLVVVQRDFPAEIEAYEHVIELAHRLGKPVVYDIDDLLIDLPPNHPDVERYVPKRFTSLRAIVEADAVTAASDALKEHLSAFNPNIYHLPNYLSDPIWRECWSQKARNEQRDDLITIGYMGGHTHAPDLEMIAPVLKSLLSRYGDRLSMSFFGIEPPSGLSKFSSILTANVGYVDYYDFVEAFCRNSFDICIAPLQGTTFNRHKSWLKYLEYSALSIPGVYSDLEPYNQAVARGKTGFLAGNLDEWEAALTKLIEDRGLREHIGQAAFEDVQANYLLSDHVELWRKAFDEVLNQERVPETKEQVTRSYHLATRWYQELLTERKQQFQELEAKVEKIQGQENAIKALEEKNQNLTGNIQRQQKELARIRNDFEKLEKLQDRTEAELQVREETLEAANRDLAEVSTALSRAQAELEVIPKLEGRIDALEQRERDLRSAILAREKHIDELERVGVKRRIRINELTQSQLMRLVQKTRNRWNRFRLGLLRYLGLVKPIPLFDPEWYRNQWPDVEDSGIDPYVHYRLWGWRQGRNPSPYFDVVWYLKTYEDVLDAGIEPLAHYLQYGRWEDRRPIPEPAPESFPIHQSPWIPENQRDRGSRSGLARFRIRLGNEVRWWRSKAALFLGFIEEPPVFDRVWYLKEYTDVAQSGVDPYLHYRHTGWREGRDPNPNFSVRRYLENYPDVRDAGIEPFDHFLTYGWLEGRNPSPKIVTSALFQSSHDPWFGLVSLLTEKSKPETSTSRHSVPKMGSPAVATEGPPAVRVAQKPDTSGGEFAAPVEIDLYEEEENIELGNPPVEIIAFYLPQFHPIPENDEFWGEGFTEWTNVTKARALFVGHHQPRRPGALGYYDLRLVEVMQQQAELARRHGISAFCFHHYWFNGRRVLDRPVDQFLEHTEIDIKFCLNWANENWTRRWDGADDKILLQQEHSAEDDLAFIEDAIRYFRDPRYVQVDGKPMFILYNPQRLQDPAATAARWRQACRNAGFDGLFLIAAQTFGFVDPAPIGFDAAVEFPPHNAFTLVDISSKLEFYSEFNGFVFDYNQLPEIYHTPQTDYTLFKTIVPGWDNTPRRGAQASVYHGSTPGNFQHWLTEAIKTTLDRNEPEHRFVFINAWNEWAESAYLEPDQKYGFAYLNATSRALTVAQRKPATLLFLGHDASRAGSQILLLDLLRWLKAHTNFEIRLLLGRGGVIRGEYEAVVPTLVLDDFLERPAQEVDSRVRAFCGIEVDLIYANSSVSGWMLPYVKYLDAPVLAHIHELEHSIEKFVGEDVFQQVKQIADHYIAVSPPVRENLIQKHKVTPERISLVHAFITPNDGADQEKHAVRSRLGMDPNETVVLGCGSLEYRKAPDLFIEVAAKLEGRGLDNWHFYWIGRRTYDFDEGYLPEEVRRKGLEGRVSFLGEKSNPEDYYAAADIFLLPSREDPFPLVVLEAADHALPAVCFQGSGGMPEFIAQPGKEGGYAVPMGDIEVMAEKVEVLLRDEGLRRRMGDQASKNLHAEHTTDAAMPAILRQIRTTAGLKPGVSIIVPTYNHASYLHKRMESILNQTYRDVEVIVLDDASTDETPRIMTDYEGRPDITFKRNVENSGSTFAQWERGIQAANSDLIWIAEDDDFCDETFLSDLLPYFDDPETHLAYAQSYAVNEEGDILFSYKGYTDDISEVRWAQPYIATGQVEVNEALAIKNTIPNASAVLFRKFDVSAWAQNWRDRQLAGDWAFYLYAIDGGKVGFTSKHLNFHRRHQNTNIHRTRSSPRRFEEFVKVQRLALQLYEISAATRSRMEEAAYSVWEETHPGIHKGAFHQNYRLFKESPLNDNKEFHMQVEGFCPICECPRTFVASSTWLRRDYRCETCHSIPRDRALRKVLDDRFPVWKKGIVHEIAPSNSFIKDAATNYSASHYDPDQPLGNSIDGVRNENLENLTLPDCSVDYLIHLDMLQHVLHPERVLHEMVRVLRPGGASVFTVPIHPTLKHSRRRARIGDDGKIEHLLSPDFDGNPVADGRALVTWDYGEDFVDLVRDWLAEEHEISVIRINKSSPDMGIEGEYLDVIVIQKLEPGSRQEHQAEDTRAGSPGEGIYTKYKNYSDDEWYQVILQTVDTPVIDGIKFPSLPNEDLQKDMVGFSGKAALEDAYKFYRVIQQALYKLDNSLTADSRILDFGCGFGRHLRFFLKDIPAHNLFGVDIDPAFIEISRETFPQVSFRRTAILPSGQFPDEYFDLIYAYSVFSHLNQRVGKAWVDEFSRLIKPGGVVIVTTHPPRFIDFCESLRSDPRKANEHPWYERLAKSAFVDPEQDHKDYEDGNFVFAATDSGPVRTKDFYGEAVVSPAYIKNEWLGEFNLIDFIDDEDRLSQAVIILRRKTKGIHPHEQGSSRTAAAVNSAQGHEVISSDRRNPGSKERTVKHVQRKPTPSEKVILPDRNAIYVVIPKTGCTSIKKFISEHYGWNIVDNVHNPKSEIYEHISFEPFNDLLNEDPYVFTFVRNPFSRLYSVYRSKRYPGIDHPNFIDGIEAGLYAMGFRKSHSFKEFVHLVCETPDEESDPHVRSQVRFIVDENGDSALSEFYRFENFQNSIVKLTERLEISLTTQEFPWENKSATSPDEFIHAYDHDLIDAVVNRYIEDFQQFGYKQSII